ncbi:MAG TPA: HupE/UreJ family protein [Woeseiaceae bacterium]|nr:HupE/UreJ family protein [Woeseiaceae bacterium]
MLLATIVAAPAHAHSQGSSRITLRIEHGVPATISLDLALIDLLYWLELDRDGDARLTWGELTGARAPMLAFVAENVQISAGDTPCRLGTEDAGLSAMRQQGESALRIVLPVDCPPATKGGGIRLRDDLFFDGDPTHRALLRVTGDVAETVHVLTAGDRALHVGGDGSGSSGALVFVGEGSRHILSGYDHLVFLFLLVLPVACAGGIRSCLARTGGVITAFTAAHSVTLTAAMTGLVHAPAKPIEIAIAASIVFAAVLNIARPGHAPGWKIAFPFGLLHGFGFAGALAELGLESQTLWRSILAFNAGIELGQLAMLAVLVPLLRALALSLRHRSRLVPSASLACAVLGAVWIAARL